MKSIAKCDSYGPTIGLNGGSCEDVGDGVGVDVGVGDGPGTFSKSNAPLTFNIPPDTHLPDIL